ncbi:MAG: Xaa-Pro aminopeptidase [Bacilli bacterium]|jgi:Xaa-Pro aminopeptidase|nr:Xaa-Pro aminopeptidase [Bacilli bacterium]MDD4065516.1 Xaa-Pro aminopeptidase [Bacilli bacterium]
MLNAKEIIEHNKNLGKLMEDNSMLVVFAGQMARKSADEDFPFTPNRNFYYLTNIAENNDIALLVKLHGRVNQFIFINRYDPVYAKWNGANLDALQVSKLSGCTNVLFLDEFEANFQMFIMRGGVKQVYLDLERQKFDEAWTPAECFASKIKEKYPALKISDAYPLIASLRMVKSPAEIIEMKKAINITDKAIQELMKQAPKSIGKTENYLEAYFDCVLKQEGASDFAFETIAASGINACTVHYRENNGPLVNGNLVMFDCGAEYDYYKSDITRTFPLNGKFTKRQLEIYNIVLKAQDVVAKHAKPGITTMELNEYVKEFLAKECIKLGLIKDASELSKYYMHGCSHHLGLDTHDACVLGAKLSEGCVISNEPGLYLEEEGIGIRIEDDLLITKTGCEYLSKQIIKKPEDIEAFMKKNAYK